MPEITADDVIRERQIALLEESQELQNELKQLMIRQEVISRRLAAIEIEYNILESYNDRRQVITYTKETYTVEAGRRKRSDRLHFEDCLKQILLAAGRPIMVSEIIRELEKFGFKWSSDDAAYQYLIRSNIIERAGKKGFYQLKRPTW